MELFDGIFINLPLILLILILVSATIYSIDKIFFYKKRYMKAFASFSNNEELSSQDIAKNSHEYAKKSSIWIVRESRSMLPIVIVIFILRSFIIEPYRIPSSSMEPTLLPGDFIIVNKYSYGIRQPFTNKVIANVGKPKRGDIAVFHNPNDERQLFIKRVVGVPGDLISFKNNKFFINNNEVPSEPQGTNLNHDDNMVHKSIENLIGNKHYIYKSGDELNSKTYMKDLEVLVPKDHYFMMGDHRSNSSDSRYFGIISYKSLVGKFQAVWLSFNTNTLEFRWDRFGTELKPKSINEE